MNKILFASFVVSILSFSCQVNPDEQRAQTESSWEKPEVLPSADHDNFVIGVKAIATTVFVVVLTVLLLTLRTTRPELTYQV